MSASPQTVVSEAQARAQLESLLASESFRRVDGQSRLLRYLVEQALTGRAAALKETVIAVEVFGRAADFDPRLDNVVRGEAMRLRHRLESYYHGEGATAGIEIRLPKGGYVPEFLHRTPATRASRRLPRWGIAAAMLGASLAGALLALASGYWWSPHSRTIAVLPFLNLNAGRDTEYLGDGLVDELTAGLSRLPGLRVSARTSAFAYRGKATDVRTIGRDLGVRAVLEGSVHFDNDQLTVTVQLIQTTDGYHQWSEVYRGTRKSVSAIEDQIVQSIARVLQLGAARRKSVYVPSEAVRDLYWRARYINRPPIADRPGAIKLLEQAISMEPNYVDAWSALSAQHALGAIHQDAPYPGTVEIAKQTIRRTLELDPEEARTHASLGAVLNACDYNWPAAEAEFRRAVALDPNNAWTHFTYGFALMEHQRFSEAVEEMRKSRGLDPLGQALATDLATIYFDRRNYAQSLQELRAILKANPEHLNALWLLGPVLSELGEHAEADATFQRVLKRTDRGPITLARYGVALVKAGRRDRALEVLQELLTGRWAAETPGVYLAYVYAALGDHAAALDCLEQSYAHHDTDMIFLGVDPVFDPLRNEPRFIALRLRMGL